MFAELSCVCTAPGKRAEDSPEYSPSSSTYPCCHTCNVKRTTHMQTAYLYSLHLRYGRLDQLFFWPASARSYCCAGMCGSGPGWALCAHHTEGGMGCSWISPRALTKVQSYVQTMERWSRLDLSSRLDVRSPCSIGMAPEDLEKENY